MNKKIVKFALIKDDIDLLDLTCCCIYTIKLPEYDSFEKTTTLEEFNKYRQNRYNYYVNLLRERCETNFIDLTECKQILILDIEDDE